MTTRRTRAAALAGALLLAGALSAPAAGAVGNDRTDDGHRVRTVRVERAIRWDAADLPARLERLLRCLRALQGGGLLPLVPDVPAAPVPTEPAPPSATPVPAPAEPAPTPAPPSTPPVPAPPTTRPAPAPPTTRPPTTEPARPAPTTTQPPRPTPTTAPAPGRTAAQAEAHALVDATRRDHDLRPLAWNDQLGRKAQAWAEKIAADGRLSHSNLREGVPAAARGVGENVGMGASVAGVHQQYLGSSGHRANILNAGWTDIGTGVVDRGGRTWTVQVFMSR